MLLLQSVAIIAAFVATTEGLTQPGNSCCQTKSVGSVAYVLADTQDTSNYGCLNNCTYTKQADGLGSQKYCFQTGPLPVQCGDQATGGTGGSGGSGGTGGTGETGGGTEAAPIRPDGGTEAAPIRPDGGTEAAPIRHIGCTVEWEFDYTGNDIRNQRAVKDWVQCADLCAQLEQCTVWTYRLYGQYGQTCFLKTSNSGRSVLSGHVSGTKECAGGTVAAPIRPNGCTVEWGFDYPGNDIPGHSSLSVRDWAECSNLCAALNECLFWSYGDSVHKKCWLKTSKGGGKVDIDRISGTKECAGWKRVFSHDTRGGLFDGSKTDALSKNPTSPSSMLYSVLDSLEDLRRPDGSFLLRICYPELKVGEALPCNEWSQSSNPATDVVITDFKPVLLQFSENSLGEAWAGLGVSPASAAYTYIDDAPNKFNWWSAVGASRYHEKVGYIPGPLNNLVKKVEMYAFNG